MGCGHVYRRPWWLLIDFNWKWVARFHGLTLDSMKSEESWLGISISLSSKHLYSVSALNCECRVIATLDCGCHVMATLDCECHMIATVDYECHVMATCAPVLISPKWWPRTWNGKQEKPLSLQSCFWAEYFLTGTERNLEQGAHLPDSEWWP